MSSHRRRRCEVPGGHLCPVLTSFPGKLKKLRHRWKRKSGGASRRKKGEPRGGSARRKPREQGSQTAHRTDKGAEAMTPNGSPKPRGRATDNRAEGRTRGKGSEANPRGRKQPGRTTEQRPERHAPAPGSRPPKGPRGPQWRKRPAAQGADGQAAAQCKRKGDPTALGGAAKRSRSRPEARPRY